MSNPVTDDGTDTCPECLLAYGHEGPHEKPVEQTESYNGPHPKRTANAEATIEAAMRYPVEWTNGFDDGRANYPTGVTYDGDPESDRSVAYDLGRNAGDLERLRVVLRAENMSYGELAELQGLEAWIDPGDPELLEAAGVPEYTDETATECGSCGAETDARVALAGEPFHLADEDCRAVRSFTSDSDVDYGDGTALEVAQRSVDAPIVYADEDDPREWCSIEGCTFYEGDGHAHLDEPDPDAMYDAARDEAHNLAVEDGKPDAWREYMPSGVSWGRV